MKTYKVVLEKGKEPVEVIPVDMAFSYALLDDLRALLDEDISEDDFLAFMNDNSNDIEENLKGLWENWEVEQEQEEEFVVDKEHPEYKK